MNNVQNERNTSSIDTATVLDRSNPRAPKRHIAKDIVENGRRLRTRIGVAAGVGIGLTALLVTFQ